MHFESIREDFAPVTDQDFEQSLLWTWHHFASGFVINEQEYLACARPIGAHDHPTRGCVCTENRMRIVMAQGDQAPEFFLRQFRETIGRCSRQESRFRLAQRLIHARLAPSP